MEFNEIVRNNLGNYVNSFYLAIKHDNEDYLKEYIGKFLSKQITVSFILYTKETSLTTHKESLGEHFHFLVLHKGDTEQLNKKVANSLMRHYVNKYNLAGNSNGTRVRQYGLIKRSIKSVANIIRYVMKDTQTPTIIPHNDDIMNTVLSLPKWEKNENHDTINFFNDTLEEIKRQIPENLNNDYDIIAKILDFYNLAGKHPPVKSTIDKYLRIVHYSQMTTYDFISKYYLNNNYNATN